MSAEAEGDADFEYAHRSRSSVPGKRQAKRGRGVRNRCAVCLVSIGSGQ